MNKAICSIIKLKGATNLAPLRGQGKLTPFRGYPRPGPLGQDLYFAVGSVARLEEIKETPITVLFTL
jgi:hypothetical protein